MAKNKWQTVLPSSGDGPEVRRLEVPGGYLYQVASETEGDDLDAIAQVTWSQPVFVPFAGDGAGGAP